MLDHAGQLGEALEGEFTPLAANLGPAQGLHQVAGLAVQQAMRLGHGLQVLVQRAEGLAPFVFHAPHFPLGALQGLADGLDQ